MADVSLVFDETSREKLATCHRDLQTVLREARRDPACPVWFGISWGQRTWEEQAELYAQGRTKPGPIVTYAKPGQTLHNRSPSFAADVYIRVDGKVTWEVRLYVALAEHIQRVWQRLKAAGKVTAKRLVWGGNWRRFDGTHFELDEPQESRPHRGEGEADEDSLVAAGRGRRTGRKGRRNRGGRRPSRRAGRHSRAPGSDSSGG